MSDTSHLAKEIDKVSRKQSLLLGQLLDRLEEKEASEKKLLAKIRVLESNHSLLLSKISECPSCSCFNDQRFYSSQTQVSMTQESQFQGVPSFKKPKYQSRSPLKEITNLEPTLNMNVHTNSFESSSADSIEYVAVASPELITSDIEEIISDSQPEVTHDDILTHYTPQMNPYITPITDLKVKVDLSTNPKFKREWFLEDFKRNPDSKSSHTNNCMCNDCSKLFELAPVSNLKNGINWDSNSAESGETPSKRTIPAGFKRKHGNMEDNTIWDDPCTPPGFNRSEFPTTQELKDDRKESSKRVKNIALYRLKEALKVDGHGKQIGKFIFKNSEFNAIVHNGNFLT